MSETRCPECGAVLPEGVTCQSVFDEFLVLEFTDPEYGEVHMLTVACYMVQHGRYSDAGLVWIEQRLRDYLERGIPARLIRQGAAHETGQGVRNWKVTRQPGDTPQAQINWSMSIVDVALQYEGAAGYRECITEWAKSVLREMQPLVDKTA